LNTGLESFEQNDDHVLAKLVKKLDGKEVVETFKASYLIGADGAQGMVSPSIVYILADHLYRFRQVSVVNSSD
jgi:2-polyprenyl-6-methoxyphenol hydroxylase-like FAD-dependent oxidoreductase